MALNRQLFTDIIHTELLPPLNQKGAPPLWEAIGKKFTNMNYDEADRLSQINKEFILNLFPWNDKIYKTLLPIEAQQAIGQVGPYTIPVKSMLEKIGFKYMKEIDPFDGGPHYRCKRDDILPIKQAQSVIIQYSQQLDYTHQYLLQLKKNNFEFCCIQVTGKLDQRTKTLYLANTVNSLAKQYNIGDSLNTFCIPI